MTLAGPNEQHVARWERHIERGIGVAPGTSARDLATRHPECDIQRICAEAMRIACEQHATKPGRAHFDAAADQLDEDGGEA